MPPIKIQGFGGATPAIDERLIADNAAAESVNAWLFSGRIEPVHSLVPLYTLKNPATQSVFRRPVSQPGIDNMINSDWLEFENQNVRVIRSPIVGQDDDGRFYWADGDYPKMMTGTQIHQANAAMKGAWSSTTAYLPNDGVTSGGVTYVCIVANTNQAPPNATYWVLMPGITRLGVPPPSVAPGLTASGGSSSTNTTVTYNYTWVSINGEEGPPSPPSTITNKIDATYHLTFTPPNPTESDHRNLANTRIYRTVVSAQGVATFYFVAQVGIATTTYDDNMAVDTDAVVVGNEQQTSTNYYPPPTDLQQLVAMANGMVAGFRNNEVWFCEPYYPHAWPVQYVIGVDAIVVGLGVFDQSLIILTQGQPYAATGVDPSAMALVKIQPLEACTSMLSIVNTPGGVLYSSPNGLINITPGGAQNLTIKQITKDQWYDMLNLDSVAAGILAFGYYAFSIQTTGVFQNSTTPPDVYNTFEQDAFQQASAFGSNPGIYISLNDSRIATTELNPSPSIVSNVITDVFNGELMQIRDGVVYLVDLRKLAPYAAYRWRSKMFSMPYPLNMGAAKVYWSPLFQQAGTPTPPAPSTKFRVFAGDIVTTGDENDTLPLRFEELLHRSGDMFRLPSGYKAMYWQFEVEGNCNIDAIHVAETPHLLRTV